MVAGARNHLQAELSIGRLQLRDSGLETRLPPVILSIVAGTRPRRVSGPLGRADRATGGG